MKITKKYRTKKYRSKKYRSKKYRSKKNDSTRELPILLKIDHYNVLFIKNKFKSITIQSNILNGFINENKKNIGVNHLLEHVLSNAYKKCVNYDCYEFLINAGLLSNASTDNNIIQYYVTGLIEDVNKMIEYIINITINPIFNEELITKEKKAVINELLISLDDSDSQIYNKMNKQFYTVEGLQYMDDDQYMIDNINKFNHSYLMKYYKNYYNNNNTLFIVSGNCDKNHITDIFKKLLPNTPKNKHKLNYDKINCFTNKSGVFHIKDAALSSTKILFYFPTYFYINSHKYICTTITASVLQAILFEHLRVKKNLIYNLRLDVVVNACGTIQQIIVNTKNNHVSDVINEIIIILNKYKKENIEKILIEAEKKRYLINYYEKNYNDAEYANFYGTQYMYSRILNTKILSPRDFQDSIMKITADDIKSIINEVFDFNKCMIVYSNKEEPLKLPIKSVISDNKG